MGLALWLSCETREKNMSSQDKRTGKIDSLYQLRLDLDQVSLNNKAAEVAVAWEDYMATQTELEQWQDYEFTEILSNTDNLRSVTDSLRLNLPDVFTNKPIRSRLKTLSSQAQMLDLYADKSEDHQAMYQQARSIVATFVGLKRQMNEVFIEEFSLKE